MRNSQMVVSVSFDYAYPFGVRLIDHRRQMAGVHDSVRFRQVFKHSEEVTLATVVEMYAGFLQEKRAILKVTLRSVRKFPCE